MKNSIIFRKSFRKPCLVFLVESLLPFLRFYFQKNMFSKKKRLSFQDLLMVFRSTCILRSIKRSNRLSKRLKCNFCGFIFYVIVFQFSYYDISMKNLDFGHLTALEDLFLSRHSQFRYHYIGV